MKEMRASSAYRRRIASPTATDTSNDPDPSVPGALRMSEHVRTSAGRSMAHGRVRVRHAERFRSL